MAAALELTSTLEVEPGAVCCAGSTTQELELGSMR